MKFDRYTLTIALLSASAFYFNKNKTNVSGLFLLAGSFSFLTQKKARVIKNNYKGSVYTKGENECQVTKHEPGSLPEDFDGIKTNYAVYKTHNGTDLIINEDGSIEPAFIGTRIVNTFWGGIVGSPPDQCWNEIFKAPGN